MLNYEDVKIINETLGDMMYILDNDNYGDVTELLDSDPWFMYEEEF